jgi:hypothetical protein
VRSSANGRAPRNAGHALYDLIDRVRKSQQTTVLGGWTAVLDAEPGTVAWAQRHAEVVSLYQEFLRQLLSLPEGEGAQSRALKYAAAWYRAIVWPENWQSTAAAAHGVISSSDLDQLGSTADYLAYRLPSTAVRPSDDAIARLRHELQAWLGLLDETEDLPESIRVEIAGQINHVLWLLDNVDDFGMAPVVRETQAAVGKVTETMFTRPSGSPLKKKWVIHFGGLLVALGLVSQGVQATNQVLEAAKGTLTLVGEIAQEADSLFDFVNGPPALPSGSSGSEPMEDAAAGADN